MVDDRGEPHVSSTLKWKDVSLPESVTVADLDTLIFSFLKKDWRKTASIIVKTSHSYEARSILLDVEIIGARIQALAEASRIESQGDLSMWRHSEVRMRQN